jgi:folate-binding protein YgfZ
VSAFAVRTTRDAVRVTGPDALSFLQGQLSQDVDALAVGTSTWTFVLQPQGKVDAWARLTKTAAVAFLLDTDAGHGAALEGRLARFKIRTAAELERSELPCVAVRGADAPRGDVPGGVMRLPVVGPGVDGYDLVGAADVPEAVPVLGPDALDGYRVVHGVPAMGAELDGGTIPAEVGDWIVDVSVSFTKGCFVGQELVARIDSRGGNVPRHLRALLLAAPVEVGAVVESDGPDGAVTTVAVTPEHGPVALAYLGRRVEPGSIVRVGGVEAEVAGLPLGGSS